MLNSPLQSLIHAFNNLLLALFFSSDICLISTPKKSKLDPFTIRGEAGALQLAPTCGPHRPRPLTDIHAQTSPLYSNSKEEKTEASSAVCPLLPMPPLPSWAADVAPPTPPTPATYPCPVTPPPLLHQPPTPAATPPRPCFARSAPARLARPHPLPMSPDRSLATPHAPTATDAAPSVRPRVW